MRVPLPSSLFPLLAPALLVAQQPVTAPPHFSKLAHTYSIVAWDSVTGDLGVAVESKFPNVGGIVPWAQAGVGAVATQSLSNTAFGEKGLELIAMGASAEEAMRIVMRQRHDAAGPAGGHGRRTRRRRELHRHPDLRLGRRSGGQAGNARWHAGWQGRGHRRPRLCRAGQHHGVRPDGEEPGRDIRADQGRPRARASWRRSRRARPAVATSAACSRPRCSSCGRTAAISAPTTASSTSGSTTRRSDRGTRAAARPARALLLPQPDNRPGGHHARHRRPARADPAARAGEPAGEMAREAAGHRPTRPSSRRCAISCTGRTTTSACAWTARSTRSCSPTSCRSIRSPLRPTAYPRLP